MNVDFATLLSRQVPSGLITLEILLGFTCKLGTIISDSYV